MWPAQNPLDAWPSKGHQWSLSKHSSPQNPSLKPWPSSLICCRCRDPIVGSLAYLRPYQELSFFSSHSTTCNNKSRIREKLGSSYKSSTWKGGRGISILAIIYHLPECVLVRSWIIKRNGDSNQELWYGMYVLYVLIFRKSWCSIFIECIFASIKIIMFFFFKLLMLCITFSHAYVEPSSTPQCRMTSTMGMIALFCNWLVRGYDLSQCCN